MTEKEAIRILYPKARRGSPVGIVVNTSRRRIFECIQCKRQISCCPEYPETKRVKDFKQEHNKYCGKILINKAFKYE